jgi:putative ABC transport system permease protein
MLHPLLAQTPMSSMTLSVRTSGDPGLLLNPMRDAIRAVEPVAVPFDEGSIAQSLERLLAPRQFAFALTGLLALLAGLLALSGQVGLIALEVQRRRSEIGVRVALGAKPKHVLSTILERSLRATVLGMGLGLAAYLAAAPVLDHFIYGIASRDAASSICVVAVFLGTALIAAAIPAWRALRLDPMQALRAA